MGEEVTSFFEENNTCSRNAEGSDASFVSKTTRDYVEACYLAYSYGMLTWDELVCAIRANKENA